MNINIVDTISKFVDRREQDPNHRYKSWEHCFKYFQNDNRKLREERFDNACLNLAFYLASWGMYRGSGGLLWKDYKTHGEYLNKILEDKYEPLKNLDITKIRGEDSPILIKIFELTNQIREILSGINYWKSIGGENTITATDALVTKILLGTIGCAPAYDRFFKDGCRILNSRSRSKISPYTQFNAKSYLSLVEFYKKNYKQFSEASEIVEQKLDMKYPQMKLIDMYFWQLGNSNS